MLNSNPVLTILMPCLNEAETLERCIRKAHLGLERAGISGEILIADNGSRDGSVEIAERCGARVVHVKEKGYGNAIRCGIDSASAEWILMGDSDDSYDFSEIAPFVEKLKEGNELVMGCRLPGGGGKILSGAMPWKNRWIGNPSLSFLGRSFFKTPLHDFHCGLRAFTKPAFQRMQIQTTGMEFATEMVMKATIWKMRVAEVPVTLYPDGRSRPPHLKPWRDGWRHLRFMLVYSPRWLFFMPGALLAIVGGFSTCILYLGIIKFGPISLDSGTMMFSSMALIIGVQLLAFAVSTKVFAVGEGLIPDDHRVSYAFQLFNLERGLLLGLLVLLLGATITIHDFLRWQQAGFGQLSYSDNMRQIIPGATCLVLSIQIISTSFFLSVLGLKTKTRKPPGSISE